MKSLRKDNQLAYKIDISNLSIKDRLLTYSYFIKILLSIKNSYNFNSIDNVINGNPEYIINKNNLINGLYYSNNYNWDFIINVFSKIIKLYDKNNIDDEIVTNANKIAKVISNEYDIADILFDLYNDFFLLEYKKLKLCGKANCKIDLNEFTITDGLNFYSFMEKLLLSANMLYDVNDIDYLFNELIKTRKEQEEALFNSFLIMIDTNNNELNIYSKITKQILDDNNIINIKSNLFYLLQEYKLFHYVNSEKDKYIDKYIPIDLFINDENKNMNYNSFINDVIYKVKKLEEDKNKNGKRNI
jgi:hypothetical protein